MTKEEMLNTLHELARQFACYRYDADPWDYMEEKQEIVDKYNALLPTAKTLGVTYDEFLAVWKSHGN